jgi:hypothetical protein
MPSAVSGEASETKQAFCGHEKKHPRSGLKFFKIRNNYAKESIYNFSVCPVWRQRIFAGYNFYERRKKDRSHRGENH